MEPIKLLTGALVAMGVSVGSAFALDCPAGVDRPVDDPCEKYLPIALKCPSDTVALVSLGVATRANKRVC